MKHKVFEEFRRIVYEKSGIALGEKKEALLGARLGKRLRALGFSSFEEYLGWVLSDDSGEEMVRLLDEVSTNVTSFFREVEHFHFLADEVRRLVAEGQRRFRFWSAACSTGEEPYTLAMVVQEAAAGTPLDLKILGTDISTRALRVAREGIYDQRKLASIPFVYRETCFERVRTETEVAGRIRPALKSVVVFSRMNLSRPPYPMHGPFDAVLCRNVMIYFDDAVRKPLLEEIHRLLRPGGHLLVGHSESLSALGGPFETLRPSIYRRPVDDGVRESGR
jgi:chemotaxis protein methyltransferase CheR